MTTHKDQYAHDVPQSVRDAIERIACDIDLSDILPMGRDMLGGQGAEAILGYWVDGWIPFQRGGIDVNTILSGAWCGGSYLTDGERDEANRMESSAIADWQRNNPEGDTASEECSEYVMECMGENDAVLLGVALSVPDKVDVVQCELYVNYADAPYFREKYAETLVRFDLTYGGICGFTGKTLMKALLDAWADDKAKAKAEATTGKD